VKLLNIALLAATGLASFAVGCSSSDDAKPANVETVRSAQQRDTHPTLSPGELDTLAKGEADFAVDIFKTVSKASADNVFLSPHSISIALGMTYAGARGDTAAEMKSALHFDLPSDRVHTGFDYLDLELASRGANATGKDGKPFRLNVSNSIWGQKGADFQPAFLDTLAVNYGAGMNVVDFERETEKSRVTINQWVESKTEHRIKDLLQPGVVDASTRAVLVNAVYFNAAWKHKFTEASTAASLFTKVDGSSAQAMMMHAYDEGFSYASGDGFEAVEMPYDGDELSMVAILPKAGTYATFETALTGSKALSILAGLAPRAVNLSFPKLKLEAEFSLVAPLEALGMKKAFGDADFSGISTSMDLSISDVVHKTFLDLDENGTEAAAATAVEMRDSAAPIDIVNVSFDRPFIVSIVDKKTKTLVFLGRILEPKAQ
jgi:serpin B